MHYNDIRLSRNKTANCNNHVPLAALSRFYCNKIVTFDTFYPTDGAANRFSILKNEKGTPKMDFSIPKTWRNSAFGTIITLPNLVADFPFHFSGFFSPANLAKYPVTFTSPFFFLSLSSPFAFLSSPTLKVLLSLETKVIFRIFVRLKETAGTQWVEGRTFPIHYIDSI